VPDNEATLTVEATETMRDVPKRGIVVGEMLDVF
jgi:hypothetical protein